jgi:hypothetical protein
MIDVAEVVGSTPKVGCTGALIVLTVRHTIEDEPGTIAVEDVDAAVSHLPGRRIGFPARLTRRLWVGDPLTVNGAAAGDGRMSCWGVDEEGYHCAADELECAR